MKTINKAFTLIEMLIAISIIIVLILFTSGIYNKIVSRTNIVYTKSLLNGIHQALLLYENATGDYPYIGTVEDQYKLHKALVPTEAEPLIITSFDGKPLKRITESFIDTLTLADEGMLKEDPLHPGEFLFLDPWGTPILYFYGEVDKNCYPNVNKLTLVGEDETPHNIHWSNQHFDIFSLGPDQDLNKDSSKNDNIFQQQ